MNFTVWTLFKLDLKSRHGSTKAISTKDHLKRFFNVALSIVLYAVLIAVFYYLTEMFVVKSQLGFEFLVIVTFVALILLTIVGTGNVVKNLYFSGDNELLLRFPVSGKDVLIAKSIYCFVSNLVICFLLLFPFYIIFGVLSGMNVGYYFLSIIVMFLISLVPFFVANLIAIPVMQLVNHVKDKFLLILIVLILLLCGGFILYMQLLKEVVQYIENNNINLFSPEVTQNIKAFANGCYPFRFYADVLAYSQVEGGAGQVFLNLLYIVLIEAAIAVCAYFTTIKCYYKTILYSIETGKTALTTKSKIVLRSQFSALFRREFLLIFRSFNYSFQYLAMAVAAPVMVYYCNDLAVSYGQSTVGSAIVPGLTLMVITLFTTIIVSFASTTVSREGMCFYHTKIIPVSYKNQVLVKLFLYGIVALISTAVSCLVVGLVFGPAGKGIMTSLEAFLIFLISAILVVSLTCMSIRVDIKHPTFNVSGDGDLVSANKNVALTIAIGVIMAVLFGLFTMLLSIIPFQVNGQDYSLGGCSKYLILLGVSVIMLVCTTATLFPTLNRDYRKIVA